MDILEDLMAIGFTEYEARVYIALLRENPTTGYQISKQSGVPRSMVYEALGRLHSRSAVLKAGDRRATLFRPVPPSVLLDRYESQQRGLVQDLRESLEDYYNAPDEDHFWSFKGRETIMAYAGQMIESAKDELMLVVADTHLEELSGKIKTACDRGVEVSALLTGQDHLDCGQVAHHPPLESELQELSAMLVIVADDAECLIAETEGEMTGTVTTNRNLVLIARQFVWMELFAQRIYERLGANLLKKLVPDDRRILESYSQE
jgi:sugar-specific transcriptional regulator TrmB